MPRKSLIDYFCFLSKVYVCAKRCWFTSLVFFRRVAQKKNETLTTERKIVQIYYNEAVSYLIPRSEPVRYYYVSKLI